MIHKYLLVVVLNPMRWVFSDPSNTYPDMIMEGRSFSTKGTPDYKALWNYNETVPYNVSVECGSNFSANDNCDGGYDQKTFNNPY